MKHFLVVLLILVFYNNSYGFQISPILFETSEVLLKNSLVDNPTLNKNSITLNQNVLESANISEIDSFTFKIGETEYIIDVKKTVPNKIGGQSIFGNERNKKLSTFVLSEYKGSLSGHFYDESSEILYEISYDLKSSIGQIQQVTKEGKKNGSEPLEVPNVPKKDFDLSATNTLADDDDTSIAKINVLALYTSQAEEWAKQNNFGSMDTYATQMIALSQSFFDNSKIYIEYNLVHTHKVNYTEAAAGTDLERVTGIDDGYMDEIHGIRDEYGADVVILYSYGFDTGGLAWLLEDPNGWPQWAFALTRINAAYPNATAHEIGHSIGAMHSRNQNAGAAGASGGLFEYSTGWRLTGSDSKTYVTVMGYEEGVSTYIPHFSNPDISYLGAPTGSYTGTYAPADNARSLNQIRHIAANYRQGNDEVTATLLSPDNGSQTTSQNVNFKWSSINTADSYKIQISNDDFTSTVYDEVVISTEVVASLSSESTYSWRVAAITSGNQGSWSNIWTFSTPKPTIGFVEPKTIVLSDHSGPETDRFLSHLTIQDLAGSDSVYAIELEFDLSKTTNVKLDSIKTNLTSFNLEHSINEETHKLSLISSAPISNGIEVFTFYWSPITFGNSVFTPDHIQLNNSKMSQITGSSIELFQVLLGDADGDVDVDSYDAASVLNYSIGTNILSIIDPGEWDSSRVARADVDGDGSLLALDASYIQQYVVGLIEEFPTSLNTSGEISVDWIEEGLRFIASDSLLGFNLELTDNDLSIKDAFIDWESNTVAINEDQGYRLGISSTQPIKGEFLSLPIENLSSENREIELVMYSNGKKIIKKVTIPGLVSSELNKIVPDNFILYQNYPNPFNPSTQIQYALPEATQVTLEVFNSVGQKVMELVNGQQSAGYQTATFDASGLSSGVYLYKLTTPSFSQTNKMLLIK